MPLSQARRAGSAGRGAAGCRRGGQHSAQPCAKREGAEASLQEHRALSPVQAAHMARVTPPADPLPPHKQHLPSTASSLSRPPRGVCKSFTHFSRNCCSPCLLFSMNSSVLPTKKVDFPGSSGTGLQEESKGSSSGSDCPALEQEDVGHHGSSSWPPALCRARPHECQYPTSMSGESHPSAFFIHICSEST